MKQDVRFREGSSISIRDCRVPGMDYYDVIVMDASEVKGVRLHLKQQDMDELVKACTGARIRSLDTPESPTTPESKGE